MDNPGGVLVGPVRIAGRRLQLDADAAKGELRVALRDGQTLHEIRGYAADKSNPITSDSTNHIAAWGGKANLGALRGRKVFIHVHLTRAELYSMTFE